ncbi:unnamed protein product (macronuclear) [Paramecium tetraurelia]|uniref:Programmed cell death protein 2 C-terminal domain-containing protein n=1 Tax=Paramecium tetraurelia TaxID=5888 RepID=A0DEI3_PARTE|nr:uncharacterized protein GSPATT00016276001 [Paramecium tetraurelia]CAK81450.1 unnamed protein product [Paramecium tetraurelia]|eukprot:XP_001448847.1 hypothetical protein (macronuclear) [Paramecium tetraurelia strain d4-2]
MNNKEEIVLGFLEQTDDILNADDELPSYANGLPYFLENEDKFESIKCAKCGNQMKLLLQIYAPLNNKHASYREIYVFLCLNEQCSKHNSSVRVFRMQSSQKPQLFQSKIKDYILSPSNKSFIIDTEIISAKENNNEFQVAEELLPTNQEDEDKDVDLKNVKFDNENKIYENYLKSTEEKEDIEDIDGLEKDQQNNIDGCFLIYQHFLTQYQNHVVRYCFDSQSKPLWFSDKKQPQIESKCPHCKKNKIFEFQINNSILTYFPELYNLEWGALYIYSCPSSCSVGGQILVEETVYAHSDEQEFISPNLKVDPDTKLVTIKQDANKGNKQKQQIQQQQQQIQQKIDEQDEEDDW